MKIELKNKLGQYCKGELKLAGRNLCEKQYKDGV